MYESRSFLAKSGECTRTIGWIDNTIDKFDQFMSSFSEFGSKVFAAQTMRSYLSKYSKEHVDHLFVDYDFLGSTGFDHIPEIVENCNVDNIYICTAYSYQKHIGDRSQKLSKDLGITIGIIPKEMLPFADRPEQIQEFLHELDNGRFSGDLSQVKLEHPSIDRSEFPLYEEYQGYTIEQRIDILDLGFNNYKKLIENEFSTGTIWLQIDPGTGSIIKSIKEMSEIPTSDYIDKYSEDNNIIPLVYSKGWSLDSLDNQCIPPSDLKNYSNLGIQSPINNGNQYEIEFLHYDNGNSYSLFAYEYFLEQGWYKSIVNPTMRIAGDLKLYGKDIVINNATVSDSKGNSVVCNVRGFSVMLWTSHRIALPCLSPCDHGKHYPSDGGFILCNRRKGLLGRNIGLEIERQILIDPRSNAITFMNY